MQPLLVRLCTPLQLCVDQLGANSEDEMVVEAKLLLREMKY